VIHKFLFYLHVCFTHEAHIILFERTQGEDVVIGKPERQVHKASHCGSKQQ